MIRSITSRFWGVEQSEQLVKAEDEGDRRIELVAGDLDERPFEFVGLGQLPVHFGQSGVDIFVLEDRQSIDPRRSGQDSIISAKQVPETFGNIGLVVDDQDSGVPTSRRLLRTSSVAAIDNRRDRIRKRIRVRSPRNKLLN